MILLFSIKFRNMNTIFPLSIFTYWNFEILKILGKNCKNEKIKKYF